MTAGQRIKAARKKAGLTQKELGEKLGITYQTLAQWENDLRNPKYDTLQRIAAALDVPVPELMGLEQIDRITWGHEVKPKGTHKAPPMVMFDKETIRKAIESAYSADSSSILSELESMPEYKALVQIDYALSKLSLEGQQEAVKRVEELTEIPRYRCQTTAQPPAEPQEGTDTTPPPEGSEGPPEGK